VCVRFFFFVIVSLYNFFRHIRTRSDSNVKNETRRRARNVGMDFIRTRLEQTETPARNRDDYRRKRKSKTNVSLKRVFRSRIGLVVVEININVDDFQKTSHDNTFLETIFFCTISLYCRVRFTECRLRVSDCRLTPKRLC